jgi:hypothetical protein
MIRKSPVIQWNRQNAILFDETIPLTFPFCDLKQFCNFQEKKKHFNRLDLIYATAVFLNLLFTRGNALINWNILCILLKGKFDMLLLV